MRVRYWLMVLEYASSPGPTAAGSRADRPALASAVAGEFILGVGTPLHLRMATATTTSAKPCSDSSS
jgi:hypothetical protein